MSDKWDAYIVEDTTPDKWEAYVVQEPEKKSFWSKMGAEITPQMWQQSPYATAIAQTGQDVATIPAHFFNQWLLNQPRSIASTMGIQYPETTNPVANLAAKGAGIAGAITSPAAQALGGIGQAFRGAPLGVKVAGGALAGGATGFAYAPTQNVFDIKQRTQQGVLGAVTGATISFVSNIAPKLINLGGRKTAQGLAEKADKGMEKLSQGLSDKYDDVFSNVKGKVATQDIADDIQNTIDEFPEGANVGKLKSILKRIQGTEEKPITEISAKDLFNIKKEISKTIPKSIWNGVSDADAITNSKEQLYWKLTQKLEDLGGDEYKGLTAEYKNFKQAERLARKMFYRQGVPSNVPLGGTYDIPTQRAVRGLSSQLPQEEQFAQQFEAWRRGNTIKKIASNPRIWEVLGLGGLGYGLLRRER